MRLGRLALIVGLGVFLTTGHARAISIVLDYSLDSNNFFNTQAKRDALGAAASVFEVFSDSLEAIVPGEVFNPGTPFEFSNTWDATFSHPGTGALEIITDMTVPADTLIVFAGGRNLSGTTLGQGGPGGFSASGISSFIDTVEARGQGGALLGTPTDFGPWGGAVTFDTPNDWHFDPNSAPGPAQSDFFSVAVHELAHLTGFGTADSFDALVSGSSFTGATSTARFGGSVPLDLDKSHWADGTLSTTLSGDVQETAMDPDITDGTRKGLTRLDYNALDDLGWDLPADLISGLFPGGDDGFVGVDDLNIVLVNWNQSVIAGDRQSGDFSDDGFVGVDDLNIVLTNWNAGTPPATAIPEPATLTLLGLGGLALLSGERGRRAG